MGREGGGQGVMGGRKVGKRGGHSRIRKMKCHLMDNSLEVFAP